MWHPGPVGAKDDLVRYPLQFREVVQQLLWQHELKSDRQETQQISTYYGAGQDPNAYGTSENPLYILDSQFDHYWGKHTFTWGGQYTSEGLEDEQPAYDRLLDDEYTNYGFYAQDDWKLTESVDLVVGARLDKHSEIDDMILSPRLALKWSPDSSLDVRASYASGFRAPQVFDEDLHITQVGGEGQVSATNAQQPAFDPPASESHQGRHLPTRDNDV